MIVKVPSLVWQKMSPQEYADQHKSFGKHVAVSQSIVDELQEIWVYLGEPIRFEGQCPSNWTVRDKILKEGAMLNTGPIQLSNVKKWEDYWAVKPPSCMQFAEDWAKLMQVRIDNASPLSESAKEMCWLAGPTNMLDEATNILIECWVHGKELERYKNE